MDYWLDYKKENLMVNLKGVWMDWMREIMMDYLLDLM